MKKNHRQLHGNKTKKLSVGQFVRPSTVTPKYVYNDGITLVGRRSSTLTKVSIDRAGQRSLSSRVFSFLRFLSAEIYEDHWWTKYMEKLENQDLNIQPFPFLDQTISGISVSANKENSVPRERNYKKGLEQMVTKLNDWVIGIFSAEADEVPARESKENRKVFLGNT